jgi:tryptophanase
MYEPYKIKVVEPLPITTRTQREQALHAAGYNLFGLRAADVTIDLLTDSGTAAMSQDQWAALMRGDESYAGARSWHRFLDVVTETFGFPHVIPAHQGRAAERLLFGALLPTATGHTVPSNAHFDTTKGNLEVLGVSARDLPCAEAADPAKAAPFKGNIDLDALRDLLTGPRPVPLVMLTVTNNAAGGQPVSMANIAATAALAHQAGVPFYLDACRFAENAYFIQQREPGYEHTSIADIVRQMCSHADGITFSAKKDGLANIGGFLATRDEQLAARARQLCVVSEGYPTYGGLAGRDLEAIAVGLREVLDADYLRHRIDSTAFLVAELQARGIPMVLPAGGHAAYIDAAAFLPHLPPLQYPAQALLGEIYLEGGVRGAELGTVTFGLDGTTGHEQPAAWELVRLALPRRVYTRSHLAYVADTIGAVYQRRHHIQGLRITEQPPVMRNFTARFAPATTAVPEDVDTLTITSSP